MLEVRYSRDKWIVSEPRLTGYDRMVRTKWCQDQWGSHWGSWYISDVDYHTNFIFHRKAHAEWYKLRWS